MINVEWTDKLKTNENIHTLCNIFVYAAVSFASSEIVPFHQVFDSFLQI